MEFTQDDVLEFAKLHAKHGGYSAEEIVATISYMTILGGFTTEEVINQIKQSGGLNNV